MLQISLARPHTPPPAHWACTAAFLSLSRFTTSVVVISLFFSFCLVISLLALVPASHLLLLEGREAFSHHFDLNCVCVSRRYVTGHIWACPPSEGDDYIFHCHPPDQKIPKPKRLQEWYKKMLDKAFAERIIHDYKVPGAETGRGGGMACLPLALTHVRTAFAYEE